MLGRCLATAAVIAASLGAMTLSAKAQDAREAEIVGFHQLCDHGDRRACVRFGMLIQQNHDRQAQWRRTHPEWFWWEH